MFALPMLIILWEPHYTLISYVIRMHNQLLNIMTDCIPFMFSCLIAFNTGDSYI